MQSTETGIRELKAQLSTYLRQVKAGGTIVITERGKPIGRIVPISQPLEDRLEQLSQAGLITWSGMQLARHNPVVQAEEGRTVAELVLEDRA